MLPGLGQAEVRNLEPVGGVHQNVGALHPTGRFVLAGEAGLCWQGRQDGLTGARPAPGWPVAAAGGFGNVGSH